MDAKLLGAGVRKWLLLPVLAAVCGAGLLLWRLGCFLPRWIVWQEADCFCTAEEGPEQLSLHRKTLRAVSDGSEIWRSHEKENFGRVTGRFQDLCARICELDRKKE